EAECLLDLLEAPLPVRDARVADDALGAVEGHARAHALLLRVHLRHHLVGDVHEEHERQRRRQHEEQVEPQEEPEQARASYASPVKRYPLRRTVLIMVSAPPASWSLRRRRQMRASMERSRPS